MRNTTDINLFESGLFLLKLISTFQLFALQLNSWILLNESCIQDRFCSSIFDDMTSNANDHCHIGKCAHFLVQSNKLSNYASFLYPPRKY